MNKQKIEEILGSLKEIHLIYLMPIQEMDSQEIIELKLECLMLLKENINLLLECANKAIGEADEGWNNWLIDRFNENLEDFKKMVAPLLGFKVKKREVN